MENWRFIFSLRTKNLASLVGKQNVSQSIEKISEKANQIIGEIEES